MKTVNIIFLFLFLFSAAIQYNDPDPVSWMFIYLFAAISCGLFIFGIKTWLPPSIIGLCAFIWMIVLFPMLLDSPFPIIWSDVFGRADMKTESIEITREILGLLIVFSWMSILTLQQLSDKSGPSV